MITELQFPDVKYQRTKEYDNVLLGKTLNKEKKKIQARISGHGQLFVA